MKILKRICLICFCFSIILLNYNVFATTGTITGKSVRLREKATTESKAITTMKKNEKVEIIGEEENWFNVKFGDTTGYVSKDYVKVEEDVSDSTLEDNELLVENTTDDKISNEINLGSEYTLLKNANLRLNPNLSSIILFQINSGDKIVVNNKISNWINITVGEETGWILKNSIEKDKYLEETSQENKPEEKPVEDTTEIIEETIKPENTTTENTATEEEVPEATTTAENSSIPASITKGYVNSETVNVRQGPSTDSKRLGFLDLNDEVEIVSEEGDWYKIKTKEYGECYIAKRLISETKVTSRGENVERTDTVSEEKNQQLTSVLNNTNNLGNEIVNYAKQYLRYKYVSGGKKPETGFDCSGFTKYVYSNFGISLGSTAASQANNSGTEVSRESLQPGDLILFQDDGKTKIGHCGIYIGDNTFIHAANPKRGVVTDKLEGNSYYSPRYVSAYRF